MARESPSCWRRVTSKGARQITAGAGAPRANCAQIKSIPKIVTNAIRHGRPLICMRRTVENNYLSNGTRSSGGRGEAVGARCTSGPPFCERYFPRRLIVD
ncbi:hypothetical protein EVAR_32823_1 [Eumeta japonica]|uniref:Uncharacterized protein n=1 Tax=Eumeta variegata TaxID=151549 RepID=A0A4C1WD80_EUMVA|nr:hypothetical protein EVAR_32823_1 [Eumeta japonica]